MSILSSIQAAEAKAQAYKEEANEKVKELIKNAQSEGEAEVEKLNQETKQKQKQLIIDMETEIERMEVEIKNQYKAADQELIDAVSNRFENAADYILKKVLKL